MFYNDFKISKKSAVKNKISDTTATPKKEQNLETISQEIKDLKIGLEKKLLEIQNECQQISKKLDQINLEGDSHSKNPPISNYSDKVENILAEVKKLQAKIGEKEKIVQNGKTEVSQTFGSKEVGKFPRKSFQSESSETVVVDSPKRNTNRSQSQVSYSSWSSLKPGVSYTSLTSLEIEPLTKMEEEYQRTLSKKVEEIRDQLQIALDGSSMQGRTIFEIAAEIQAYKHSFAVQITNLMDSPLVDLELCDHGGVTTVPNTIPALEIQALTFGTTKGNSAYGIFTYLIQKTDIRLVVYYSAFNKTTIAFAPADTPIDHSLCTYMSKQDISDWSTRPDKRGARVSSKEISLSISLANFVARATLIGRNQVVMKLEILKSALPPPPALLFRNDDSNSEENSLDEIDSKNFDNDDVGYFIEITNSLHLDLTEPRCHLEDGANNLPNLIGALRKRTLPFKIDSMDDMIITYRIGTTDLRLAVAFGNDSQFSLCILPASVAVDSKLLASMCDSPQWKTRPDLKLGFADEGETIVNVRNYKATAAMSVPGKIPNLKITITSTDY